MGRSSWIGGALGFVLGGGPIGAIIGAGLGYLVDEVRSGSATAQGKTRTRGGGYSRNQTVRGDFNISFLVLIAAIMKADGKVLKSELDFVKAQLNRMLGPQKAPEAIRMLGDLLKQEIPVQDVCLQIGRNMDIAYRREMLHLLFGVSAADGHIDNAEINLLRYMAGWMRLSEADFNSIKSMFVTGANGHWAYDVLEIKKEATDDDVKKAYRSMARKYHPDKVSHLGEEFASQAKEKFQKVSEAFESIKKERGIK